MGAVETISNGDKYSNVQFVVFFCTFLSSICHKKLINFAGLINWGWVQQMPRKFLTRAPGAVKSGAVTRNDSEKAINKLLGVLPRNFYSSFSSPFHHLCFALKIGLEKVCEYPFAQDFESFVSKNV